MIHVRQERLERQDVCSVNSEHQQSVIKHVTSSHLHSHLSRSVLRGFVIIITFQTCSYPRPPELLRQSDLVTLEAAAAGVFDEAAPEVNAEGSPDTCEPINVRRCDTATKQTLVNNNHNASKQN